MNQLAIGQPATPKRRSRTPKLAVVAAAENPIAAVCVDVTADQVDRVFDYVVPEALAKLALPGVRVRVRFAGRLVNGYLLARSDASEHVGTLSPISKVLGVPVLTPEIAALSRAVADRYAGTLAEILRDAIPPRHARAEAAANPPGSRPAIGVRGAVDRQAMFIAPTDDPAREIADLVDASPGRALVVVPDGRDLTRFASALVDRFGADGVVELSAAQKPQRRYTNFLRAHAGDCRVVVGTRTASFAPLPDLRLLVIWDDGDDSLIEVRSPGWHARTVLALRSQQQDVSLIVASHSRSVEAARMVETGWLTSVEASREARHTMARVVTSADDLRAGSQANSARVPHFAWQTIRDGLTQGPVLVQVARAGYITNLACERCREQAICPTCTGQLGATGQRAIPHCRWCGARAENFACPQCGGTALRSITIGSDRTAEELARVFGPIPIHVSGRAGGVLGSVSNEPAIVVATVGAEPVAAGGYAAAILLDATAQLARADLNSEEQTLRRWFNVAALVRPRTQGGRVAITAAPEHRAVQALVRVDPVGWADRELADRHATRLPPAVRAVTITGSQKGLLEFRARFITAPNWRTLGPVPVVVRGQAQQRLIVTAPNTESRHFASAVKQVLASTPNKPESRVSVRLEPATLT